MAQYRTILNHAGHNFHRSEMSASNVDGHSSSNFRDNALRLQHIYEMSSRMEAPGIFQLDHALLCPDTAVASCATQGAQPAACVTHRIQRKERGRASKDDDIPCQPDVTSKITLGSATVQQDSYAMKGMRDGTSF